MSAMLTRTWNYIHSVATDPSPGWSVPTVDQRHSLPPGLAAWLQQVTSCLDKDEENELCRRQLEVVMVKLSQKGVTPGIVNDCMVRLVYMHMLGYDCSAGFIHCVKLAGSGSVLSRKMGYLACSVMIPSTHQLALLVTNSILRDLESNNIVDIQMGLVAAANLVKPPMVTLVPLLSERVISLTSHRSHLVRKKALILLNHLCDLDRSLWEAAVSSVVIGCLSDINPGVAATALQVTACLASDNDSPSNISSAMVAGLHLQSQALASKLPEDFLYKGHMAPFLRMDITRLFRKLHITIGKSPHLSEQVKSVLTSCLEESPSDIKDLVVQSLIYETILTVAHLPCCHDLVPLALKHISSFLTSRHQSTVYTGICGLEVLFKQQPPSLTKEQEVAIMSCLSHKDPAIRRRTLQLLVVLASKENVGSVVDNIVGHVKRQGGDCSQVLEQVAALVDRFGESLDWKASTLLRVVQVSKDKQRNQMTEKLKFLLSNPLCEDGDLASVLELNRVRIKLRNLLSNIVEKGLKGKPAPVVVTALHIWCEGQFSNLGEENSVEVMDRIVAVGRQNIEHNHIVKNCMFAIQKLTVRNGKISKLAEEFIADCNTSSDDSISQTATEVLKVTKNQNSSLNQVPSTHQDWTLSFLDSLVSKALEGGAQPYIPKSLRLVQNKTRHTRATSPTLQLKPYNVLPLADTPGQSRSVSICSVSGVEGAPQLWTLEGRNTLNTKVEETEKDKPLIHGEEKQISCGLEMVLADDWE